MKLFTCDGEGSQAVLTRGLFWCLFPELRSNKGNKHQNNTWVSAVTVHHLSTYIILFLTWHNNSINDNKTKIFTHRPHVSLARVLVCWWRHNRLLMTSQWPDNCDAITWIVISNSFLFTAIFTAGRVRKVNKSWSFANLWCNQNRKHHKHILYVRFVGTLTWRIKITLGLTVVT